MKSLFDEMAEIERTGKPAAICVITETHGSTPLKTGAKMIVYLDGKISGTVGGGTLEKEVIKNALEVIHNGSPKNFTHNLVKDHQMCCGGIVKIYIEPAQKANKLYIFGAGHIGRQVAYYAEPLNFRISIFDERKEMLNSIQISDIDKYPFHHDEILSKLTFDEDTFIIICTHLHHYDREILAYCIKKHFHYLGMIGSKRKVEITKKIFLQNNVATEAELENVDMPMGLDIGGETPAEIAISILAKLIEVKNSSSNILKLYSTETLINEDTAKDKTNEEDGNSYGCGKWNR